MHVGEMSFLYYLNCLVFIQTVQECIKMFWYIIYADTCVGFILLHNSSQLLNDKLKDAFRYHTTKRFNIVQDANVS